MKRFILIALFVVLFAYASAGSELYKALSDLEKAELVSMLKASDLDSASVCFERDWDLSTRFKTTHQLKMLNDPWFAIDELGRMRTFCAPDSTRNTYYPLLQELWQIADPRLASEYALYQSRCNDYKYLLKNKVKKADQIFAFVEELYADVSEELNLAFDKLSAAQKDSLSSFFFVSWMESEDKEKYADFMRLKGISEPDTIEMMDYAAIFEQIDFASILRAYAIYQAGMDMLIEHLPLLRYDHKKTLIHESIYGVMLIGTTKGDYHSFKDNKKLRNKAIAFVFDPAGNDTYELDINADWQHPLYMQIDLKGDDIYRSDTPAALFCVIGGIGASYDAEGNDLYHCDDYAFSAFLGQNLHLDKSGDDVYQGGLFNQGAAMFGVAVLIDEAGSDSYNASSFAQALGGTLAVGALLDYDGDDRYYIGGKYFHKPLMPNDYRSMGQGMGFGFRPDFAGGLGLLYDRSGNDKYIGGVYAQGVAYWYAGGILIDENGNDVYNAIYYPQGSGIHLAYGMLFDGEGDDNYYTRNGPGQGAGHDWSLGILIDKSGNDAYSIPGGNGLGLSNSVGIFVESSGDDRYERKDSSSLGYANLARGTGGIGLFLDAGGKDSYPDTLYQNDFSWQRGVYGIGKDLELNIITKSKVEEMADLESADIDSLAAISDIFSIASEWEVGSAIQRVRKARGIMLSRHTEAADYVIQNKMNTKSGLEYRALEELVKNSQYFKAKLYNVLYANDSLAVKNAIALISSEGDSLLTDFLQGLLESNKYVPSALNALGNIKNPISMQLLASYMNHSSERYRFICARSLINLKMPEADALLESHRDDPSFLVRTMIRNRKR